MALRSDAHLTESCKDERSLTVAGVKDYPLWEPERQTLVDSSQPHALAKPVCLLFKDAYEKSFLSLVNVC